MIKPGFTDRFLLSTEPNPNMGHLAWADAFVVTADSVSLISEACSTGYAFEGLPLLLILRTYWFTFWFQIYIAR